ncbi:RNA ligase family protein [Shouchella clausii]|uniref:ATP-dependent DNA ligase n=1 Tax=Shouchella clausii TaxID=79880 RepID=UPI002E1EB6F6|nr:RNA ligase family protein [Shouchella clausii]MED4176990.1 RNA ligase family protein [Shouchella clausii]
MISIFVSPMLLNRIDTPTENNWLTELKFDGIRLILSKHDGVTRLYTRHNTEITNRFPELCANGIEDGTILDGELIVLNDDGQPDFELVMSRFRSYKTAPLLPVQFVVFDIIKHKHTWTTSLPLIQRKEILSKALPPHSHMTEIKWIEGNAEAYFDVVCKKDLEGIVVKDPTSTYKINKRTSDWLKIINYKYTDGLITGYRKGEFGLLIESFEGETWGIMEHMSIKSRKQFYELAKMQNVNEDKKFFHLETPLPCKIRYRHVTKQGYLRIPTFIDWLI